MTTAAGDFEVVFAIALVAVDLLKRCGVKFFVVLCRDLASYEFCGGSCVVEILVGFRLIFES